MAIPQDFIQELIARADVVEVVGRHVQLKKGGANYMGLCPFHAERTPSFSVEPDAQDGGSWHCFGCGKGGDCFALYAEFEGLDLRADWPRILECMAGMAGMGSVPGDWKPKKVRKTAPPPPQERDGREVPRGRALSDVRIGELAALRGLSIDGVRAAARDGRVRGDMVGISRRCGMVWGPALRKEADWGYVTTGPLAAWMLTDAAGIVTSVRRFDGQRWPARGKPDGPKAWTCGTSTWPIGCLEIGRKPCVAIVEGGPDMLAAYHFLCIAGRLSEVAVVMMLSASVDVRQDARQRFMGKRVRIFPQTDKVDPKNGRQAGFYAAEKWARQIRESWGVDVDEFRLPDGANDLNEAAEAGGAIAESVAGAFVF